MKFVMFSKHIQEYSIEKALQVVGELGLAGLDLTVRPGGHITPENVETELPRAVAAARKMALDIPMLTTAITSPQSPGAEATFATAAAQGVKLIKLGYWTYDKFGGFRALIAKARADLEALEPLAKKHRVCACVHIHSGNFVSANSAIVERLIAGLDPEGIGAFLDPGHMFVEGMYDGWRQGIELLIDRTKMVAVKSIAPSTSFDAGRPKAKFTVVPLETGPLDWKLVFELLRKGGFDGLVTLHSEYDGLPADKVVEQTKKDWDYVQRIIGAN